MIILKITLGLSDKKKYISLCLKWMDQQTGQIWNASPEGSMFGGTEDEVYLSP